MKVRSAWNSRSRAVGCLALFPMCTVACSGTDGEDREVAWTAEQAIAGGQVTGDHPEVGQLLVSKGTSIAACTGTVVSCNAVLTAGHCVPANGVGALRLYLQGAFDIQETFKFGPAAGTEGNAALQAYDDLGLVRVEQVPSTIAPAEIAEDTGQAGAAATTYGYGCEDRFTGEGGDAKTKKDWVFDPGIATDTGLICDGDSGGPTFVGGKVVSVASGLIDEYEGCGPGGAVHKWDYWALPWNPAFQSQAAEKINEWAGYCDHC